MRTLLAGLASVCLALALSSCQSVLADPLTAGDGIAPTSLTLVLQATDNAAKPYVEATVEDDVQRTLTTGGQVAIISAEGRPVVVASGVRVDARAEKSDADILEEAITLRNGVMETIAAITPTSPGLDMVRTLELAASTVAGAHPVIVVVAPGLSDTGTYNLTKEGMSQSQPAQLVAQHADNQVPKFAGAVVRWWWLGQGRGDQQPLSQEQMAAIGGYYEALITRGGGSLALEGGVPDTTVPSVETAYALTPITPTTFEVRPVGTGAGVDVFDGRSQLSFASDSADFLRPEEARQTAIAYAGWLRDNPRGRLVLTGTTASSGDAQHLQDLSGQRAEAFRSLILAAGGDSNRVSAQGNGIGPHQPDFEGQPNEDAAAVSANRAVTVERIVG